MLNREKYAKEIAEIACNGKHIAIVAGKPMLCCEASCDTCDIIVLICAVNFTMPAIFRF